jgi:hypothetical protein
VSSFGGLLAPVNSCLQAPLTKMLSLISATRLRIDEGALVWVVRLVSGRESVFGIFSCLVQCRS